MDVPIIDTVTADMGVSTQDESPPLTESQAEEQEEEEVRMLANKAKSNLSMEMETAKDVPPLTTDQNETIQVVSENGVSDTPSSPKETMKTPNDQVNNKMMAQAMTLDVAYTSLEMVRKVNLHVEFGKEVVDETHCVPCLRLEHSSNVARSTFGKWMSKKAASPCLACGSPVCKLHRSSEFGKQNIVICLECAGLFSIHHGIQHIFHEQDSLEQKKKVNSMLEVYDRTLLVLKYSSQFIDGVLLALQGMTSRHNKVGLGSSATGVISGGLGVAAACTILTPVGPPLLLASILFGGGATAAAAGSEAVNYRCEPNKMADRILTLYALASSIAKLPAAMNKEEAQDVPTDEQYSVQQNDNQSRLHWTRTAMVGLKPLTAGALSAVSIFTEAREMKATIDKIRAGNPCEKAERLSTVAKEMDFLPTTDALSHELSMILERQATTA